MDELFPRPIISLSWTQIVAHANNVFEFSTIEPLRKQIGDIDLSMPDSKEPLNTGAFNRCLSSHGCVRAL